MPTTNAGATLMLQPMRGALVAAATKYLALYVGDPTSGGTEVTGTGYARLERSTTQISITNNELSVTMGEWDDSADVSWGTPDYVALMSLSDRRQRAVLWAAVSRHYRDRGGHKGVHQRRRHHVYHPAFVGCPNDTSLPLNCRTSPNRVAEPTAFVFRTRLLA